MLLLQYNHQETCYVLVIAKAIIVECEILTYYREIWKVLVNKIINSFTEIRMSYI